MIRAEVLRRRADLREQLLELQACAACADRSWVCAIHTRQRVLELLRLALLVLPEL